MSNKMQNSWLAVLTVGVALAIISIAGSFWMTPSMSTTMTPSMMSNTMFWFSFWPVLLVASLILIPLAVIMNYAYPPIVVSPTSSSNNAQLTAKADNQPSGSIDVIMKILKPEELRVINVIRDTGGTIRQSDIARQTNFSRLKVHRVIARLAERGIIRVERAGKTNNIHLAEWFTKGSDK